MFSKLYSFKTKAEKKTVPAEMLAIPVKAEKPAPAKESPKPVPQQLLPNGSAPAPVSTPPRGIKRVIGASDGESVPKKEKKEESTDWQLNPPTFPTPAKENGTHHPYFLLCSVLMIFFLSRPHV